VRARILVLSSIAAAVAARPAAAQARFASEAAHVTVRPVATYLVVSPSKHSALPARVTVADSSGTLVATYTLPGETTAHPMVVAVDGTDILLGADTRLGAFQITLYNENERGHAGHVSGRWTLGTESGVLAARRGGR